MTGPPAAPDPAVRARVRAVVHRRLSDVTVTLRWSRHSQPDRWRVTQMPGSEQLIEAIVDGVFAELGRAEP